MSDAGLFVSVFFGFLLLVCLGIIGMETFSFKSKATKEIEKQLRFLRSDVSNNEESIRRLKKSIALLPWVLESAKEYAKLRGYDNDIDYVLGSREEIHIQFNKSGMRSEELMAYELYPKLVLLKQKKPRRKNDRSNKVRK